MVRDALRFLIPVLILASLFLLLGWHEASLAMLAAAAFIVFFFRNPRRDIPVGDRLVVSPADGRVVSIRESPDAGGSNPGQEVSIFLGLLDVHLNRSPVQGVLERVEYRKGRFKAAFRSEASRVNAQNVLTIRGENGNRVVVRQVAGVIARRVVCWRKAGEPLARGELFGLIRFGSRVDVLLPAGVRLHVRVGDRVRGGTSVLGGFE